MEELIYVYAIGGVIAAYFLAHVISRRFDPFAPTWLFLIGYVQVYFIQALNYHDWAVGVRGKELVASANCRALWALLLFLAVYHLGIGGMIARALRRPPRTWSPIAVAVVSPPLIVWGLFCAGLSIRGGMEAQENMSAEEYLIRSFPFLLMVAATMLIVTGRTIADPRPAFFKVGLLCGAGYVAIWMFNGKRSHSLIGVLCTVCAVYTSRLKRPSWPVLLMTASAGILVVAIAIGWRNELNKERSFAGFVQFLGDFRPSTILESLNMSDGDQEITTYETQEYGGFLLMMDTVPGKSDYDFGANYIRVVSTFIPRLIWADKPIFGRMVWIKAWIAGSEMERDEDFQGPAISLLGATQLNGGAVGTVIVITLLALLLRTAYDYFRLHADAPWVQFWWSVTYFNAWLMVVNDDPMIWFYYIWGYSTLPIVVLMWWLARIGAPGTREGLLPRAAT